jgi:hypothetical protein
VGSKGERPKSSSLTRALAQTRDVGNTHSALSRNGTRPRGVEIEIKGGCLSGAVRYAAEADATTATVCHCRDCQKFTGSAFAALVRATKEAVTIEGTLKTFTSIGGSGNPILRHFCPECGSSIAEEPGTRSGIIILNVGTFDQPAVATPGREIFRSDALPWVEVHGENTALRKTAGLKSRGRDRFGGIAVPCWS